MPHIFTQHRLIGFKSGPVFINASFALSAAVYTPWSIKKRATLFLTITPMFHGGFLHLLYQWKQE